jgi:hypothetical protein
MRVFLGAALFMVLSGIALFGIGLVRDDMYYIASGIPVFFIGTIFAGIVLGKCIGQEIAEEVVSTAIVAQQGRTVAISANTTNTANTANPVRSAMKPMKKNKSDTDLELMGAMDDESNA